MTRLVSRHYPFSHRFYALHYIWDFVPPTLSSFNSPTLSPTLGEVTKLTDLILPDAPPAGGTWGGARNALASYQISVTKPASFPGTWMIQNFTTLLIEVRYFRRTQDFSGIYDPLLRQQRRTYTDAYYISAAQNVGGRIRASDASFNVYDINVEGRWGASIGSGLGGPDVSEYIEAPTAPTIFRFDDTETYNEHTTNFTSLDWTLLTDTTFSLGTVPTDVSDYMNSLKDTIKSDLAAATLDVTWRSAALAGSVPSYVTNRSALVTGTLPQVAF